MADLPNSMRELISQAVSEHLQNHLATMSHDVNLAQLQVQHSLEQLNQVSNQIQDQRATAQLALDTLASTMRSQVTQSPCSLRSVISGKLDSNKLYHVASCYYESQLRYFSACGVVNYFTYQSNMVSHAVALEINRAMYEASITATECGNYLRQFTSLLDNSIMLDVDCVPDYGSEYFSITVVFPDGLAISYCTVAEAKLSLGGLPLGTFVYINGAAFEIGDRGFYQLEPNLHEAYRVTNLLNDGKV